MVQMTNELSLHYRIHSLRSKPRLANKVEEML
jgi:hypothetical protein